MSYSNEKKRLYDKRRYDSNVKFLREYKLSQGCTDCSYNEHHAGLQFDHIPGRGKTGNVCAIASRNKNGLIDEIKRCEVVCATCHAIRTFERGQYSTRKGIPRPK